MVTAGGYHMYCNYKCSLLIKIIQNCCNEHTSEYIEVLDPEDLQLRPIVAGPNCETSHLSNLLDILLKPFIPQVKSFLRDSVDFLNCVPETVPECTQLISFDIVSLYSNIPHELGYEAISFWLDKDPGLIHERFNKNFILEGLKIVLENNNFSFNEMFFNQIKGTAMGTKVAPTYATLVLGYLEEQLYKIIKQNKDDTFAEYVKKEWKRFLDDCFIFWNRSAEDLVYFENILNLLNKDIHFTKQQSAVQLPFLDIEVQKNGTSISTDVHFKITDSKQYLNFKSCHPKHTKTNIPFSLARRLCTIVSDKKVLSNRLIELAMILIERQYPLQIVKTGIIKAMQIPRSALLNVKQSIDDKVTPFVSTHNPKHKELFGILKSNMVILNNDITMKKIRDETKFIKSKRQLPNLKRLLTKSQFSETDVIPCVKKCNEPRCGLCSFIIEGNSLKLGDKSFHVKESMDCTVQNVLYVLVCNGCRDFYIGQTGDKLRNRRTVHDQQIRDPLTRQMPMSGHLDKCSKSNPKFGIFPFYKFHNDCLSARLSKERYFIEVFKPPLNNC